MSTLFDMVAGTSTGSILASALAVPSKMNKSEPGFYANDIVKLYQDNAPLIFKRVGINTGLLGTIIFFSLIIGGVMGYHSGVKIYSN